MKASTDQKVIASITLRMVENRDGVRYCYCDTISALDESKRTAFDVAKFQFHCFHWFAAMHEILVRKLVHKGDVARVELQKHAEELRRIERSLNVPSERDPVS